MKFYFIATLVISFLEILTVSFIGTFGISNLSTCVIKEKTNGSYVFILLFCINVPIMWAAIIKVFRNPVSRRNKAIRKMTTVIFSLSVAWGIPQLSPLLRFIFGNYISPFDYLAIFLGCSSGIIICFARLGFTHIIEIIREISSGNKSRDVGIWLNRERKLTKNPLIINEYIKEELSIAGFFDVVTKSITRDMIIGATLVSIAEVSPENKESYAYKKQKYIFALEDLNRLERTISITLFHDEKSFEIWEYQPEIFQNIREVCGWSNTRISQAFIDENNFTMLNNINNAGRSSAFIFRTENEQLIVKTITKQEKYLLLEILDKYFQRILTNQESRIVRILGLYKLKPSGQSFILMENIFKNKDKAIIFDLKGSLHDRYTHVTDSPHQLVMKDRNFIEMDKKVILDSNIKSKLVKAISDDAKFFEELGIIDYSLIIAFYSDEVECNNRYILEGNSQQYYSIGIIDFLQEYTLSKKFELIYKKMKCKKNLSVCPPDRYAARFNEFMSRMFYYNQ